MTNKLDFYFVILDENNPIRKADNLPEGAKRVLEVLLGNFLRNGQMFHISNEALKHYAHVSKRDVAKYLEILCRYGLIRLKKGMPYTSGQPKLSTVYWINEELLSSENPLRGLTFKEAIKIKREFDKLLLEIEKTQPKQTENKGVTDLIDEALEDPFFVRDKAEFEET